jgi:hypothetical protein
MKLVGTISNSSPRLRRADITSSAGAGTPARVDVDAKEPKNVKQR